MKRFQWLFICVMTFLWVMCGSSHLHAEEFPAKESVPVNVTLLDQVEVPARDAGELEHLEVREGATVKKGDLLGNLNHQKETLQVEQAALDLEIAERTAKNDVKIRFARKALEVARKEYERSLESVKKYPKSISQTELDYQKLTAEKSELEVEQTEKDKETALLEAKAKEIVLRQAKLTLSKREIHAPFSGRVVQLFRQRGEWVKPGDKVMRIVRLDRLRVEGLVTAQQASKMKEGQQVQVKVSLSQEISETVTAQITFIHPEANLVDGKIRFWAEIDNKDGALHPGLRGVMLLNGNIDKR